MEQMVTPMDTTNVQNMGHIQHCSAQKTKYSKKKAHSLAVLTIRRFQIKNLSSEDNKMRLLKLDAWKKRWKSIDFTRGKKTEELIGLMFECAGGHEKHGGQIEYQYYLKAEFDFLDKSLKKPFDQEAIIALMQK